MDKQLDKIIKEEDLEELLIKLHKCEKEMIKYKEKITKTKIIKIPKQI